MTVNGQKDIWPSWFNSKTSGAKKETLVFNKVTKKIAKDCTPESLKDSIEVTVMEDPVTKTKVYSGIPEGYDRENEDSCTTKGPTVVLEKPVLTGTTAKGAFTALKGSSELDSYVLYLNGNKVDGKAMTTEKVNFSIPNAKAGDKIKVVVTDKNGMSETDEKKI